MSKKQIVPSGLQDEEWSQIVNSLVEQLDQDTPDKVVRATELMIAGYPTYKVAKEVGVSTEVVRRWISQYPVMAAVVSQGRQLITKWRMAKLEQQFLTAIERSEEILESPLSGVDSEGVKIVDPKILTVVAAQARYIIGLFAGQKVDVTVKHELGDTVLKAKQDALDYLATRMAEQDQEPEPIETTYRIIDERLDNMGPTLLEDGSPPFGEIGVVDTNEEGTQCHLCGDRFKSLPTHLTYKHNMTVKDYEILYLLEEGSIRDQG